MGFVASVARRDAIERGVGSGKLSILVEGEAPGIGDGGRISLEICSVERASVNVS